MSRTASEVLDPRLKGRLDALGREAPEAAPWLALVEEVLREASRGAWARLHAEAAGDGSHGPRLEGARVRVPLGEASRWVARLLARAGERGGPGLAGLASVRKSTAIDPLALLEAGLRQDAAQTAGLARRAGVDEHAFAQVAHLATLPLLLALRATLSSEGPAVWRSGPCPVCGAYASLAESRGLAREHRLRCGRCGFDGLGAELMCAFCGQSDHERLRALAPDGNPHRRRVLACLACRGFLRIVPTLEAIAPEALLLEDLAHVDLDLVALERAYARPPPRGLGVTLVPAERS